MQAALVLALGVGLCAVASADETIHIDQKITPVRMARLRSDPSLIPAYSDDAILSNAWVRAWVWLEVDARGVVQRVKFIKRPGHGLDQIAVDFALARDFAPAVNQFGHEVASLVYMPIEWPSHDWLVDKTHGTRRLALSDMIQVSVDYTATGGPPAQLARSKLPPCTLGAPLPLDKLHTASGIPLVYRDCSRPDLSHTSAAEPWFTRR